MTIFVMDYENVCLIYSECGASAMSFMTILVMDYDNVCLIY